MKTGILSVSIDGPKSGLGLPNLTSSISDRRSNTFFTPDNNEKLCSQTWESNMPSFASCSIPVEVIDERTAALKMYPSLVTFAVDGAG